MSAFRMSECKHIIDVDSFRRKLRAEQLRHQRGSDKKTMTEATREKVQTFCAKWLFVLFLIDAVQPERDSFANCTQEDLLCLQSLAISF